MTQQQQQPSEGALRVAAQIAAAYWGERWDTIVGEVRERHLRVLARMIDAAHTTHPDTVVVTREYRDALVRERDDLKARVNDLRETLQFYADATYVTAWEDTATESVQTMEDDDMPRRAREALARTAIAIVPEETHVADDSK